MKKFTILRGGAVSTACMKANMTDTGYFYVPLPSGRGSKRIWVNRGAIRFEENSYVIEDELDYRVTEKGNVVLMKGTRNIVIIQAECGYRGTSNIKVLRRGQEVEPIARGAVYHSPRGSLGVSDIIIVALEEGDIIEVNRTGRLYGADPTLTFVYVGGELIEHVPDEELEALL